MARKNIDGLPMNQFANHSAKGGLRSYDAGALSTTASSALATEHASSAGGNSLFDGVYV